MKPPKRAVTAAQTIREFIAAELLPGDRLPSEAELTRRLGVSRMTVREALGRLWVEGLVTRRWGVGTFVRERPLVPADAVTNVYLDVGDIGSLSRRIKAAGHTPALSHAHVERIGCPATTATEFGLRRGDPIWRVERCITIDGAPGLVLRDHVPTRLNGTDFDARPLTDLDVDFPGLIQRAGVRVVRDEARLDAVHAPRDAARLLGVPAASPLVHAHQTSHADTSDIVVSTHSYYRSEVFAIVLVRTVAT